MKRTMLFLFVLIIFLSGWLYSVEIKNIGTIPIDQSKVFLQRINKFVVTEDEYYLFPDAKAGDVKIYDNQGRLAKVFGRKGYGPLEFVAPYYCDYKNNNFIVLDWGRYKLQSYQRINKTDFKSINETLVNALGYDLKYISKNRVLISGYVMDEKENEYDLYFLDPETQKKEYILPDYIKYGCSSKKEKDVKFLKEISPLSMDAYCEYINGAIYFVWKGDLKIMKINPVSKKVDYFGKKTNQYVKPVATSEIVKAYNNRDKGVYALKQKMSWVNGIFADNDFIALVYSNYKPKDEGWQTILQFYTLKGDFIEEKELPGAINISNLPQPFFYYSREKKILYYLAWLIDPKYEDVYKVLKFKISLK